MSGAQGAQPPGARTDTTYEIKEGSKVQERLNSTEDSRGVDVKLGADESKNPAASAGEGGPVFGDPKNEKKGDIGLSGTG